MRRYALGLAAILFLAALAPQAEAGRFKRAARPVAYHGPFHLQTCHGAGCAPTTRTTAYQAAVSVQTTTTVATTTTARVATLASTTAPADLADFLAWLNFARAHHRLAPVAWDSSLAHWAALNSQAQARRGLGHFVMGPARRQNSAYAGNPAQLPGAWWFSTAHRAGLLDPGITRVGVAGYESYWTYNAN